MRADAPLEDRAVTLSLVLRLYNNAETLDAVVRSIHSGCRDCPFEIVLVNDGSTDDTETVCTRLAEEFKNITVIHLSRTFGSDNAVMAGLKYINGEYAAVMDACGRPGIENVLRMLEELRHHKCDVVYGAAIPSNITWPGRLRQRLNNRLATFMMQKPVSVSLSGFKVMNRFVVTEIGKYSGSFPFVDGLIYRTSSNIRQIALTNLDPNVEQSEYSISQRVGRSLNMFLNYSITPLRLSAYIGLAASALSVFALVLIYIDKIYFTKNLTPGIRTVLAVTSLFAGVQLMILGLVGEYLGRLFLDNTGTPQSITRYVRRGHKDASLLPESR